MTAGAEWLAAREVRVRGDWAVQRPTLAPGGFPFEFANDNYPDVDDSAEVVLALRRAAIGADAADRAVAAGDHHQTRRFADQGLDIAGLRRVYSAAG